MTTLSQFMSLMLVSGAQGLNANSKNAFKLSVKNVLRLVPLTKVQELVPKLSWLIDQSFWFIESIIEKEFGLAHPVSLVVFGIIVLLVSYIPMMILNSIMHSFSMRAQKKFETMEDM